MPDALALPLAPDAAPPPSLLRLVALGSVILGVFFLASTAARNSDLWLRFATGREIVEGHGALGSDPFAYTTSGVRWINPTWLSSVALYSLYSSLGGYAVVVAKACIFTATFVLIIMGARGARCWLPAAALTVLAAIASSTAIPVRPVIASYFLLSLTLWILLRRTSATRSLCRSYWVLLPVFALWANLDEWFFLGPVALIVFAVGQVVGGDSRLRSWLGIAVAGFAVCLLNPFFYRVFRLPPELGLIGIPQTLVGEAAVRALDVRPYDRSFFSPSPGVLNPAAIGFWVLAAISAASLARPAPFSRWTRGVLWAAFFALAILHARAIPFFAVVAAVLAGMSFPGCANSQRSGRRETLANAGLLLGTVAFVLAAWTGWLQTPPYGPRRLGSRTRSLPPPGGRTNRGLARLGNYPRMSGSLHFPRRPPITSFGSRGEKVFLDSRWDLYRDVAKDYEAVCEWCSRTPSSKATTDQDLEGKQILDRYKIGVVLVHDSDSSRSDVAVGWMAAQPASWEILAVSGRSVSFGWRPGGHSPQKVQFNLDRLAFDPDLVGARNCAAPYVRHWFEAFDHPAVPPARSTATWRSNTSNCSMGCD